MAATGRIQSDKTPALAAFTSFRPMTWFAYNEKSSVALKPIYAHKIIAACSQTAGMAKTWAIPFSDKVDASLDCEESGFGSASQISRAAPQVTADNSKMICRNASVRCARLAVSPSAGSSAANKVTMIEPITAATTPLPPSSKPKARPWD